MWLSLIIPASIRQLISFCVVLNGGVVGLLVGSAALSSSAWAIGEKLMDQLISSDFVYDRNISNAPPLMIGYLDTNAQNGLTFDGECPSALAERADTSTVYAGYVARYRHSARFHSYLGLIYTDALERALVFPYAAFDWFVDDRWTISAILPWPLLTYSPNPDQAFKVGALVTGSSWASASDGDVYSRDFTQLNLGFVFEQRLSDLFWGEFSLGYAGLGRFSMDSDQDSAWR